jgi:hypothetical protein
MWLLWSIAAAAPVFEWPSTYSFHGRWRVPYTNLSNALAVSHEPTRQYSSELNGLLRQWNTGPEEHFHRKIVTAYNQTICYGYQNPIWDLEFTEFLPNPDGYILQQGIYQYNGRLCKLFIKTLATAKPQTWKLYLDYNSSQPVAYVAQAISIYGSHYDQYILEIDDFQPFALPGVWVIPDLCLGNIPDDPYPGSQYNLFFPSSPSPMRSNPRFSHSTIEHLKRTIIGKRHSKIGDPIPDT